MSTDAIALVTGGTGWLGSRLVAMLTAAGREVRCFEGDVRDRAALDQFTANAAGASVFHCAGVIHPRRAAEFDEVNATGTSNVLDAAINAGARRFIHVSSNSPFGANPSPSDVFDESSPYNPYMGYGRSKMKGEQAVIAAGERGRIETVVIRAPWFYGPGQPPRQTQFFTMIKKGAFPIVGGGENRRSMAYVDNLAQGLLLAERVDAARGHAFWIADERPYSMNEIVDTVERVLERDFKIAVSHKRTRVPSIVSDTARVADRAMQSIGLYDQRVHVLSEMNLTIACSIAKAKQLLGYQPAVALEEGMRRSIEWVLAQGLAI